MMPSVSDFRLGDISSGYASVFYKEKCVGVLEKVEWASVGTVGTWFARYYPCQGHAYQHQQDRSAQAVAWGKTRKECFEKFVELMIRNSR